MTKEASSEGSTFSSRFFPQFQLIYKLRGGALSVQGRRVARVVVGWVGVGRGTGSDYAWKPYSKAGEFVHTSSWETENLSGCGIYTGSAKEPFAGKPTVLEVLETQLNMPITRRGHMAGTCRE